MTGVQTCALPICVGVPSNKSLYQLAQACLETDTDRLAQTEGEGQSALI